MRKLVIPKYYGRPSIGLALFGCANRPFYHVCVYPDRALGRRYEGNIIEQLGTFDPLPNSRNEKLVSLNFGRLKYWIGERDAHISVPVLELLGNQMHGVGKTIIGLSGLLPIHPKTFIRARHNRESASSSSDSTKTEDSQEEKINFDEKLLRPKSVYRVIETSKKCVENYNLFSPQDVLYEPPLCPTGLLSVNIGPIVRLDNTNLLPHIELNISVATYEQVDSVTIRLHCLYAPDAEDIYCHDVLRMMDGDQWLWPCRSIVFSKHVSLLPFYFGYSCFRMFGLSQYMINVTVFPQNCRSTLIITSPTESQLSPDIAMYYSSKNVSDPHWSPLLIVDLSEKDGVWLRVERPPSYYARIIAISIFERNYNGVLRSLQTVSIVHPSTSFKWRNVAKGEYVVYAHIPRHDCVLVCEEFPSAPVSCRACKHTVINFTVAVDRASISWMRMRRMRESTPSILSALACVVVAFTLCGAVYLLILRRRVRHSPIHIQEMELHEKPRILLLTPDDCIQHSAVVLLLGRLLEKHLGVTVLLDYREMSNSVIRPYNWLVDSICHSSHVLIIISPCSQLVLDGQHLQQRRPFPDLFVPAISMIMREYAKAISSNKYIVCRLPYSPPTCSQLSILGFPEVEIPSNFARLTALIHAVDTEHSQIPADCPVLNEFMQAVRSMTKLMETNKEWLEQRFFRENAEDAVNLVDVPIGHETVLQTDKERTKAAEKFGLLPPEDNEGVDTMEFALLPPDSSDED